MKCKIQTQSHTDNKLYMVNKIKYIMYHNNKNNNCKLTHADLKNGSFHSGRTLSDP